MSKLKSYQGLGAVVTGASSGIGRELALRLAARGVEVALVARRKEQLEELAAQITGQGGRAVALPCDVSDRRAVEASASFALERLGKVDLLINNAGYGRHRDYVSSAVADMEQMMRTNYLGSLYWAHALLPSMLERGSGWMVFMASVAGRIAPPGEGAYSATKFATVGLAESLSIEVEDAGVHVLTVCPGTGRTDFFDDEALRAMPAAARRSMVEAGQVDDAVLWALERGKRMITYPRKLSGAYLVKALMPGLFRTGVKRATL